MDAVWFLCAPQTFRGSVRLVARQRLPDRGCHSCAEFSIEVSARRHAAHCCSLAAFLLQRAALVQLRLITAIPKNASTAARQIPFGLSGSSHSSFAGTHLELVAFGVPRSACLILQHVTVIIGRALTRSKTPRTWSGRLRASAGPKCSAKSFGLGGCEAQKCPELTCVGDWQTVSGCPGARGVWLGCRQGSVGLQGQCSRCSPAARLCRLGERQLL